MPTPINHRIWPVWAAGWTFLVLLGYWAFHPYYAVAITQWPNAGLILTLMLISGGVWYFLTRTQAIVRGWMVYAWVLLLSLIVLGMYASAYRVFPDGVARHLSYFTAYSIGIHAAFLFILVFHIGLGTWLLKPIRAGYSTSTYYLISLAVGISVMSLFLFAAGAFGQLKTWVVWPVVALVSIWRYRTIRDFLRDLFLAPVSLKGEASWRLLPLFVVGIAMAIVQVGVIKAFPVGFDGALLYMNTTHILADRGFLPRIGQSYNWELFMSLGEVLFRRVAVSIQLSHGAMLLCMWAIYRVARLVLSRSGSWLAMALMYLNPAFAFHALFDEKVDLGFLFVSLAMLLLILEYDPTRGGRKEADGGTIRVGRRQVPSTTVLWALAGWLSGFAFGIKYTGLLVIVGMMSLMAYRYLRGRGAAGVLLSALGLLFLAGINRFGYLELGETPGWAFALTCLLPGMALLVAGWRRHPEAWIPMVRTTLIFGVAALLCFSPWMAKHLREQGRFAISHLVQGKPVSPRLDVQAFLAKEETQAGQPEFILEQSLRNLGVELRPDQLSRLAVLAAQLDLNKEATPGSRMDQLMDARNKAIDEILDDEQRQTARARMAKTPSDTGELADDLSTTFDILNQMMSRRGFELDNAQKEHLMQLLRTYHAEGKIRQGDRMGLMGLRDEIFEQVLSPDQKSLFEGVRKGEVRRGVDRALYRTSLFGGVQQEEIKRYIGYEPGLPLFLSLPYDMTMNTQVPFSRYLDISFLLLLVLPFLFWGTGLWRNMLVILGSLLIWTISVYSLYSEGGAPPDPAFVAEKLQWQQGLMPSEEGSFTGAVFERVQTGFVEAGRLTHGVYAFLSGLPFYAVFCLILLLGAGAWWLLREKGHHMPDNMRYLGAFGITFGLLWVLLGNAIVWYGFPMFALLFVAFAWYFDQQDALGQGIPASMARTWWRGAIVVYGILSLFLFFVSGQPQSREQPGMWYNHPFLQFASGPADLRDTYAATMPYMEEVVRLLNADPTAKVYRVGTFFNYHIVRNDRRVLEDNQLGVYEQTVSVLRRKDDFVRLLKEEGFKYVLYDLNTTQIDRTPDKSLTKKANDFFLTLANSPMARPILTDNFIQDPAVPFTQVGKVRVPGKPGIGGVNTLQGSYILFELL